MPKEIERKFLVKRNLWQKPAKGKLYRQGYIFSGRKGVVRVRTAGQKGFLTIKGPTKGATRLEFEYEIPLDDANEMLKIFCNKKQVEKIRYEVKFEKHRWEVDEFKGKNSGLLLAEIELSSENEPFKLPEWAGEEVTANYRYYNAYLAQHPFSEW